MLKNIFLLSLAPSLFINPLWAKEQPQEVAPRVECMMLRIDQVIHFEAGQSRIREVSLPILDDVASIINVNPGVAVQVEGHADVRESAGQRQSLAERRVAAVIYYLVKKGVYPEAVIPIAWGADRPISSDPPRNRRVEFRVIDKPEGKEKFLPGKKKAPSFEDAPGKEPRERPPRVEC